MKWAKKAWNYFTCDITHKKSKTQNQKNFFIADSNTCQVFWRFEQLSSAFGTRIMPAQRHMQTAGF